MFCRLYANSYLCDKKSGETMRKEDVISLLDILRSVTKILKVFPFVYAALIVSLSPFYLIDNVIGNFFYVSPIVIALLIILSYRLKFCKWYRVQCTLPLLQQCVGLFGNSHTCCTIFMLYVTILTLSLVNTYFVFIRNPHLHRQG